MVSMDCSNSKAFQKIDKQFYDTRRACPVGGMYCGSVHKQVTQQVHGQIRDAVRELVPYPANPRATTVQA